MVNCLQTARQAVETLQLDHPLTTDEGRNATEAYHANNATGRITYYWMRYILTVDSGNRGKVLLHPK